MPESKPIIRLKRALPLTGKEFNYFINSIKISTMSTTNKIDWKRILQAIAQAIIAALTALGISSCVSFF